MISQISSVNFLVYTLFCVGSWTSDSWGCGPKTGGVLGGVKYHCLHSAIQISSLPEAAKFQNSIFSPLQITPPLQCSPGRMPPSLPSRRHCFYNALLEHHLLHEGRCETFVKYRENKWIVTKYVQNVRLRHEHKQANMLAVGQLHHQSATAPSCTTHAVDAVAAHRYHELWSHTHTLLNDRPNGLGRYNRTLPQVPE